VCVVVFEVGQEGIDFFFLFVECWICGVSVVCMCSYVTGGYVCGMVHQFFGCLCGVFDMFRRWHYAVLYWVLVYCWCVYCVCVSVVVVCGTVIHICREMCVSVVMYVFV